MSNTHMISIPSSEWEEIKRLLFETTSIMTKQAKKPHYAHDAVLAALRSFYALLEGRPIPSLTWEKAILT